MRIAICDDEQKIREMIAEKVQKRYPAADIHLFRDGEELVCEKKLLQGERYDILFLDIQMPGRDGMEVARWLRDREEKLVIIFVTGAEEYVFQAFDVGAFHYLVKPFSDEKFEEVLQKAVEQVEKGAKKKGEARFLVVKSGGRNIKVPIEEIEYAEVLNRKVTLHLSKGEPSIVYYGKISELEALVGEDFFRVHRAYLVHLKYVKSYDAGEVRLESADCIMAKVKYRAFVKAFMRYLVREEKVGS